MKAFKAYDIRGIYNTDFTKEDVYKIGYYLPELLHTNTIAIGRDVRMSSDEIWEALCNGILDSGNHVHDYGLTTTPFMYWVTARYSYGGSVMITASHNPKEYNGLKISGAEAVPIGYDTGLKELETWIQNERPKPVLQRGIYSECEKKEEYVTFQKRYVSDFTPLKLVVDCSNGMANLFVKKLLPESTIYLFDTFDGTFPNHEPNPLEPKNIEALQQKILETGADIGVIYDGDADRVMFVDEKAQFISPDLLIAVLGEYLLKKTGKRERVLQDIRTSKSVTEYVEALGGEIHMWRVGRAYAAMKLREIDGLYGGELAGHYYFRDFYYSDSGIMASLLILTIFADKKRLGYNVSEVVGAIKTYCNSGELNFTITEKSEAMEAVKNYFCETECPTAFYDFDGYRIEFSNWWFNIRPSNTEPYLRLIVEAKTQSILDEKLNMIQLLLKEFMI